MFREALCLLCLAAALTCPRHAAADTPPATQPPAIRPQTAQEILAGYKGWVHFNYDDERRVPWDENIQTGADVQRDKLGDGVEEVQFTDALAEEGWSYVTGTHEVTVYSLEPEQVQGLREVRRRGGTGGWQVADAASFELDPETKRVTSAVVRGRTVHLSYPGEIKSIFDLGAPKDAKVVDHRATKEVLAVCWRLQERAEKPFPDGVMVVVWEDGVPKGGDRNIKAYARTGQTSITREYAATIDGPVPGKVFVPEDWRITGANELFRQMASAMPISENGMDATSIWEREFDRKTGEETKRFDKAGQPVPSSVPLTDQGQSIWESAYSLRSSRELEPGYMFGFGPDAEAPILMTSPDRPGLVNLRATFAGAVNFIATTDVRDRWFDPAHNDCLVRVEMRHLRKAAPHDVVCVEIWDCSSFAALPAPDSRTYPAKTTSNIFLQDRWGNLVENGFTSTRLLQFFPGKTLPPIHTPQTKPTLP